MDRMIIVKAIFDPEARVWYTESSDIHGLRLEDPRFETLLERIPGAIQDLLECGSNGDGQGEIEIPVEIIANATTRVRCLATA
jgi:hypothetical protein